MTAAVCGTKRSHFADDSQPSTPPSTKKLRCGGSSSSPIRSSSPRVSPLEEIKSKFPRISRQVSENVLQNCGNDLESAFKILHEISESAQTPNSTDCLPSDWVELFVSSLMGVSTLTDARSRVYSLLQSFEKSFGERKANALEAINASIKQENSVMKEQLQSVLNENSVLKKAFAYQYERQKGFEEKDREVAHLNEMVSQLQGQVRHLELNNYALSMHLRQAQSHSISGHFNPDVF